MGCGTVLTEPYCGSLYLTQDILRSNCYMHGGCNITPTKCALQPLHDEVTAPSDACQIQGCGWYIGSILTGRWPFVRNASRRLLACAQMLYKLMVHAEQQQRVPDYRHGDALRNLPQAPFLALLL